MEEDSPRYYIDEQWFTAHNKSFRAVAQTRMCVSCRKKIGTEVQERVPTIDARGRVVYEMRSVPFASSPLSEIRRHCSKESGYLNAETPILAPSLPKRKREAIAVVPGLQYLPMAAAARKL